jgi:hypothetical protein
MDLRAGDVGSVYSGTLTSFFVGSALLSSSTDAFGTTALCPDMLLCQKPMSNFGARSFERTGVVIDL